MASKATTTYILNVSSSMKDQENEGFQKALNIVVNSIENKVINKHK
jgi:hypothetical protein